MLAVLGLMRLCGSLSRCKERVLYHDGLEWLTNLMDHTHVVEIAHNIGAPAQRHKSKGCRHTSQDNLQVGQSSIV